MSADNIPGEGCSIKTYVFLDLETTGLPESKPRITEISLIAIHRHNLLAAAVNNEPRIIDKLTICIYPMKPINMYASELTDLYSDTLLYQKDLDDNFADMLLLFLARHEKPVCLIAHNGNKFDFPLLRSELVCINRSLPEGILCVDSLLLYRDLDSLTSVSSDESCSYSRSDSDGIEACSQQETPSKNTSKGILQLRKPTVSSVQRKLTFPKDQEESSNLETSEIAGTTEATSCRSAESHGFHMKMNNSTDTAHLLCESSQKYSENDTQQTREPSSQIRKSFSLRSLHQRIIGSDLPVTHRAEGDCMALLRIFHKTSARVLPWVDAHAIQFDNIDCMYSPQKRKPLPPGVFPNH